MTQAYRLAITDSITAAFRPRGAAGRWNSKGGIVVYAAEHPALAALEMLTAWDDYEDFSHYHLYHCQISQDAVYDAIPDIQAGDFDVHDQLTTRRYGDNWAQRQQSVGLRVPSIVSTASYNYLLNPDHPDFERAVMRTPLGLYRYDERLLTLLVRATDTG